MTGEELRRERQALGATQAELAEAAGVHRPEVSRAEAKGLRELRRGTALQLGLGLEKLKAAKEGKASD